MAWSSTLQDLGASVPGSAPSGNRVRRRRGRVGGNEYENGFVPCRGRLRWKPDGRESVEAPDKQRRAVTRQ